MIPQDPDALLGRKQTADALTEAGYPVAAATLTTMASRGGGPPAPFLASRRLSSRSAAAFLSVQRPNLDKMGVSCIFLSVRPDACERDRSGQTHLKKVGGLAYRRLN